MKCSCVVLSSVACPVQQYLSTLSYERHDLLKNVVGHKMCVVIFSTNCVWSISHCKKNWARYDQKCTRAGVWSIRYSSPICVFKTGFQKILKCTFPWKSVHWEPSSCERTDRHDESDVYWTVHHCDNWRIKNQLDATWYCIVHLIGSTCFKHYYAHHQELVIIILISVLVVSFLVCCTLEVRCG